MAELARTVKEIRRKFPSIPVSEDSQGETARLRLTEAFHQLLETIAEDHPVILVIDDLHLCDDASLSVLHLIMHRVRNQPIMLMLVGAPANYLAPQAARLRASAHSLGIQELEVPPLSERRERRHSRSLLNPSYPAVDASLRRAMIRAAGGFPLVLELLVQDWEAKGDGSLVLALDAMTADFGGGAGHRLCINRFLRA